MDDDPVAMLVHTEDRLTDVAFWKEQLAREMRDMNAEIEHLLERKAVMEKMLFDSQRSLAISEECMLQREKRTGIDQTFDDPEKGLCKVRSIIHRLYSVHYTVSGVGTWLPSLGYGGSWISINSKS